MLQALVAAWLLAGPVGPAAKPQVPVRVLASRGGVDIVRGAGLPSQVAGGVSSEPDALLVAGDRMVLREKASIRIQDPSGVLQFIGPGEAQVVSVAHYYWQGDRALISAQGGAVQISVEGGTIHVGSGLVRLRRNEGGVIIESLGAGEAAVIGPAGISTLKPNAGLLLPQAGSSAKGVPLPEAPQLLLPGPHASLRAFRFKWRSVPDAAAYRLELSRDPLFQEVVYAQESTTPAISDRARSLPVGLLFWRVATRSREGFEGIPSEARAVRVAP